MTASKVTARIARGTVSALAVCIPIVVASSCAKPKAKPPAVTPWKPGIAYASPGAPVYRGFLDLKGLIHSHNIHSHDACDGNPNNQDTAAANTPVSINTDCFQQFRDDLCVAQIDFDFLTDHGSQMDTTGFDPSTTDPMHPVAAEGDNAMLFSQTVADEFVASDQLITRNGAPIANMATCRSGQKTLIIPGREGNNLMPIGISQSEPSDPNIGYGIDTSKTTTSTLADINATIAAAQSDGALVMLAHPEDMTEQQLASYNLDGQEMYNLHENALLTNYGLTNVLGLILNIQAGGDLTQTPDNADLLYLAFWYEDPQYLARWAYSLSTGFAQGQKRVTTMGSDCHQNAIPEILSTSMKPTWDNMRGDRYQRVMRWFSNHLLVTPYSDGSWDDQSLKTAISAERLYGVFEVFGYPEGFDYHATVGTTVVEMGGDVQASASPVLSVKLPTVKNLDPSVQPPAFNVRILLASGDQWIQVANGPGDLTFTPTQAGVYRAEIREIPYHLRAEMGPVANAYLSHDYVWIYSNAIYVH